MVTSQYSLVPRLFPTQGGAWVQDYLNTHQVLCGESERKIKRRDRESLGENGGHTFIILQASLLQSILSHCETPYVPPPTTSVVLVMVTFTLHKESLQQHCNVCNPLSVSTKHSSVHCDTASCVIKQPLWCISYKLFVFFQ